MISVITNYRTIIFFRRFFFKFYFYFIEIARSENLAMYKKCVSVTLYVGGWYWLVSSRTICPLRQYSSSSKASSVTVSERQTCCIIERARVCGEHVCVWGAAERFWRSRSLRIALPSINLRDYYSADINLPAPHKPRSLSNSHPSHQPFLKHTNIS